MYIRGKYMWLCVDEKLKELQKKIDYIEDTVVDYRNNKKWKLYRQQQDLLYEFKRQEMEDDRSL